MEQEKGIFIEHVGKAFRKEQVLSDVNLVILPGQICGIIGKNGADEVYLRIFKAG